MFLALVTRRPQTNGTRPKCTNAYHNINLTVHLLHTKDHQAPPPTLSPGGSADEADPGSCTMANPGNDSQMWLFGERAQENLFFYREPKRIFLTHLFDSHDSESMIGLGRSIIYHSTHSISKYKASYFYTGSWEINLDQ